jgi:hypothetical protein
MAYQVDRYSGIFLTAIEDGTVDTTTDLRLVGKNYAGYGEIQNENFLHLMEHFANGTPPANAISGQIWYDTTNKRLKFYTGDLFAGQKIWKTAGGVEYGSEPLVPIAGDMWFDTTQGQLKVRTATDWLTVGPQAAGQGVTQMVSQIVKDLSGNDKAIIIAYINDEVVYVISKEDFYIDSNDTNSLLVGFQPPNHLIKKGLSLPYVSEDGVSTTGDSIYWGTASAALGLVGEDYEFISTDKFVRSDITPSFSQLVRFATDDGFTLGAGNDLAVYIDGANVYSTPGDGVTPVIENKNGGKIVFKVNDLTGAIKTPLILNGVTVLPGLTDAYTLGSPSVRWNHIYSANYTGVSYTGTTFTGQSFVGNTFSGTAAIANAISVSGVARSATTSASPNTVAIRDSSGSINATNFSGVLITAQTVTATTVNGANFTGNASSATALKVGGVDRVGDSSATANTVVLRDSSGGITATALSAPAITATTVTATTFTGTANQANSLNVSGIFRTAATTATANSIAVRDASGNLAGNITGTAANAVTLSSLALSSSSAPGANQVLRSDGSGHVNLGYISSNTSNSENPAVSQVIVTNGIDGFYRKATIAHLTSAVRSSASGLWAINISGLAANSSLLSGLASATTSTANTIAARDGSGGLSAAIVSATTVNATTVNATTFSGTSFTGTAANSNTLSSQSLSTSATANSVAGRDASGNITANLFVGTATAARYADLAEKYLADADYEAGTVVVVGGEKEVTASSAGKRVLGVVSTNPAFMMNKDLEGGTYIALKGRVPVKVSGPVNKGDELVAGNNGTAVVGDNKVTKVFAIALETDLSEGVKLIEAVVL